MCFTYLIKCAAGKSSVISHLFKSLTTAFHFSLVTPKINAEVMKKQRMLAQGHIARRIVLIHGNIWPKIRKATTLFSIRLKKLFIGRKYIGTDDKRLNG